MLLLFTLTLCDWDSPNCHRTFAGPQRSAYLPDKIGFGLSSFAAAVRGSQAVRTGVRLGSLSMNQRGNEFRNIYVGERTSRIPLDVEVPSISRADHVKSKAAVAGCQLSGVDGTSHGDGVSAKQLLNWTLSSILSALRSRQSRTRSEFRFPYTKMSRLKNRRCRGTLCSPKERECVFDARTSSTRFAIPNRMCLQKKASLKSSSPLATITNKG